MVPFPSIGTPWMMLPNATPSSTVIPSDEPKKNQSQVVRQAALSRFERNSMATVRRMSTSSTSIMAR